MNGRPPASWRPAVCTLITHGMTPWLWILLASILGGVAPPSSLLVSLCVGTAAFALVGGLHARLLWGYRGSRVFVRSLLLGAVGPFAAGLVMDLMLLPVHLITDGEVRFWWTWLPFFVLCLGPGAFAVVALWLGATAWWHQRAFHGVPDVGSVAKAEDGPA